MKRTIRLGRGTSPLRGAQATSCRERLSTGGATRMLAKSRSPPAKRSPPRASGLNNSRISIKFRVFDNYRNVRTFTKAIQ